MKMKCHQMFFLLLCFLTEYICTHHTLEQTNGQHIGKHKNLTYWSNHLTLVKIQEISEKVFAVNNYYLKRTKTYKTYYLKIHCVYLISETYFCTQYWLSCSYLKHHSSSNAWSYCILQKHKNGKATICMASERRIGVHFAVDSVRWCFGIELDS